MSTFNGPWVNGAKAGSVTIEIEDKTNKLYLREQIASAERFLATCATLTEIADPWVDGDIVKVKHRHDLTYIRARGQWRTFGRDASHTWRGFDADVDRWLESGDGYYAVVRGGKVVAQ